MYSRPYVAKLISRLREPRRFMQIVAGPRQAGKTTLVRQALDASKARTVYASADEPTLRGHEWTEQQWNRARIAAGDRAVEVRGRTSASARVEPEASGLEHGFDDSAIRVDPKGN